MVSYALLGFKDMLNYACLCGQICLENNSLKQINDFKFKVGTSAVPQDIRFLLFSYILLKSNDFYNNFSKCTY